MSRAPRRDNSFNSSSSHVEPDDEFRFSLATVWVMTAVGFSFGLVAGWLIAGG